MGREPRTPSMTVPVGLVLGAATIAAAGTVVASRVQLSAGGPGVMAVTVPLPALLLLVVAALAAARAASFLAGVVTGAVALVACFVVVAGAVATEGIAWMAQRGIWVLDADPPRGPVGTLDIALDFFATGLWLGHLAFWLPWPLLGAALGVWAGRRTAAARAAVA